MLREMTIHELIYWRAYSDLEPWDQEWEDLRIASTAWHITAALGVKRKKLADFLLKRAEQVTVPKPVKSWESLKTLGKMIAAANEPPAPKKRKRSADG
jgi:hypothetical protein